MSFDKQITPPSDQLHEIGILDMSQAFRNFELLRSELGPETYSELLQPMLNDLSRSADPDMALNNFERFVSALTGISRFISLCRARPDILHSLFTVLGASRFLSSYLINNADASLILGKQLIAAKLNINYGVALTQEIRDSVESADELVGSTTVPMSVIPRSAPGKQMTKVAGYLESFNKGELTGGCSLTKSSATENKKTDQLIPGDYVLNQNYPNPFNPTTQIAFSMPEASWVTLRIYDSMGRVVKTLLEGMMSEGIHQVTWDATDNSGNKLAGGIYFYRLTSFKPSLTCFPNEPAP